MKDLCKCGTRAKKRPRSGKRCYRHKCPHGLWCDHGHRLKGAHANHNWSCAECVTIKSEKFQDEFFTALGEDDPIAEVAP